MDLFNASPVGHSQRTSPPGLRPNSDPEEVPHNTRSPAGRLATSGVVSISLPRSRRQRTPPFASRQNKVEPAPTKSPESF